MEPVTLRAPGLLLRPWTPDDVDAVHAALADPDIRLWNGSGAGSREDTAALVARRADWSAGDHASFAVTDEAGLLLGSVSLHAIDRDQADAEMGYWVVPAARGRQVAVRAVDVVCGWGFATLAVDRVQLFHAVENEPSGRVAARAGFTLEGRLRRSHRYGDGVRHDELLWSRLSDDPPAPISSRS
ncbi:GNAT family N-acetyltransferase [Modestobacter sp. I12A-02628]|uniref:GNAT family N-acetyltransferase n=1 Tax=Goekera deserti TaxID=2497753 RepID=A0A7K3WGZ2_9ACTN|nr:GNAT family N-acetyltransferase [Goekera deserti]MPR00018.1 GNAT family N-acetyltransferase [Goekera deserti]NDI49797.1 GNAT family N-acetyltransferase [Goekera deserti]NEL55159.1 GNAT family N-acetyltransferase [Goekera deserti]